MYTCFCVFVSFPTSSLCTNVHILQTHNCLSPLMQDHGPGVVVLDAGAGIGVQSCIGSKTCRNASPSRVHTVLNFIRYKADWQNHIYKCVYNILSGFTTHDHLLFCTLAQDGQVGRPWPQLFVFVRVRAFECVCLAPI